MDHLRAVFPQIVRIVENSLQAGKRNLKVEQSFKIIESSFRRVNGGKWRRAKDFLWQRKP